MKIDENTNRIQREIECLENDVNEKRNHNQLTLGAIRNAHKFMCSKLSGEDRKVVDDMLSIEVDEASIMKITIE